MDFIISSRYFSNASSSLICAGQFPCKSELGKISKLIVEKENWYLLDLLSLNLWKNSDMVMNWFSLIKNKCNVHSFSWISWNFVSQ